MKFGVVLEAGQRGFRTGTQHTMCASYPHWQLVSSRRLIICALFMVLGVLLLRSTCEGTRHKAGTGRCPVSTVTLTRPDNGKSIQLCADDNLVIRLDENPTTGYQWAIGKYDAEVVTLQSAEYVRSRSAVMGGGGQRIWTFKAQKTGVAPLQLKLWRAWEGDASIVEWFRVTIQVRE